MPRQTIKSLKEDFRQLEDWCRAQIEVRDERIAELKADLKEANVDVNSLLVEAIRTPNPEAHREVYAKFHLEAYGPIDMGFNIFDASLGNNPEHRSQDLPVYLL